MRRLETTTVGTRRAKEAEEDGENKWAVKGEETNGYRIEWKTTLEADTNAAKGDLRAFEMGEADPPSPEGVRETAEELVDEAGGEATGAAVADDDGELTEEAFMTEE